MYMISSIKTEVNIYKNNNNNWNIKKNANNINFIMSIFQFLVNNCENLFNNNLSYKEKKNKKNCYKNDTWQLVM